MVQSSFLFINIFLFLFMFYIILAAFPNNNKKDDVISVTISCASICAATLYRSNSRQRLLFALISKTNKERKYGLLFTRKVGTFESCNLKESNWQLSNYIMKFSLLHFYGYCFIVF